MAADDPGQRSQRSAGRLTSMRVWCFRNSGDVGALSGDSDGDNLPPELSPWTATHALDLVPERADERVAITLIQRHGFCCFKLPPPE